MPHLVASPSRELLVRLSTSGLLRVHVLSTQVPDLPSDALLVGGRRAGASRGPGGARRRAQLPELGHVSHCSQSRCLLPYSCLRLRLEARIRCTVAVCMHTVQALAILRVLVALPIAHVCACHRLQWLTFANIVCLAVHMAARSVHSFSSTALLGRISSCSHGVSLGSFASALHRFLPTRVSVVFDRS